MKRLLAPWMLVTVAALAAPSAAQEAPPGEAIGVMEAPPPVEDPGECTTTTTVRCTGAAARYGVPPALPPSYPAVAPPLANPIFLDLGKLTGDGWRLSQHSDGTLWRQRRRSTDSPGMWGTGLALFSVAWLGAGVSSLTASQTGPLGFFPVLGAWMNAGASSGDSCGSGGSCDNRGTTALWALDGLVQAAGFTMFLVGLVTGPSKLECQPVLIAPGAIGSGAGLTAVGRF